MHVEALKKNTHPFAEAEIKTLLLFVNVKQQKNDSSKASKNNWVFCFSVFTILGFP
jgi:hypothetical protein